jgi:CubicO group peptidase (beta-lactamase class C family)
MTFDPTRLNRIPTWMQSYIDAGKFAGASALIAQNGEEAFFHACGRRDLARDLPFERDTVVRIYSMTKPVTSVALMMLVERGLIQLNAPVSDFIPSFANPHCLVPGASDITQVEPCAPPTLQHLLTHSSGLSYSFNPGIVPMAMEEQKLMFAPGPENLAEMTEQLAQLPLAFRPGTHWEYSVGIDVIGRVIEIIAGQTLEDFFIEEIFDPLGMNTTRFRLPEGTKDRFTELYTSLEGDSFGLNVKKPDEPLLRLVDTAEKSPFLNTNMQSGGGGLVGTIDDYMAFTEMLRTGGKGLLSPHTLSFMMRNHLPGEIASMGPQSFAEQPMEGMGFGIGGAVVLDPARAGVPGSVGDFSWGGMASTFFWVDPVQQLSVVFFTQLMPSSTYPNRPQFKALVHGALR